MTEAALTWHRLPSRVLLLRVLELIKSFIIPLVLLFVINNDWSSTFGIILRVGILLFLLFDILQKFFGWLNFRYALDEKTVYIIDGNWIKKRSRFRSIRFKVSIRTARSCTDCSGSSS
ncbi:hypothetical protein [Exiguobacterium mexicanum]|uniref:hypothetical protein n=1 Tax=Exiguobacterium mexicanum TaxID=340146 RepID=UPI0037BF444C